MASSDAAMAPASPNETEGSGGQEAPKRPPVTEQKSGSGAETQSEQTKGKFFNQIDASSFPPLFDEIKFLHQRLAYLEGQVGHHWKTSVEYAPPMDSQDGQKPEMAVCDDDDVLRKHVGKARSGRRWVEMTEQSAADGAEERKSYGQEAGRRQNSMYHVREDGTIYQGTLGSAIFGSDGWSRTHALPDSDFYEDDSLRWESNPFPYRGLRPPTSMRPFYENPTRDKNRHAHPPRLSRKLGPPSRWDESDSEEWSSDTSTGSQDFKYFRARLRGDFEWELDRLNAQVMRYKKHQDKKKSRQLAIRAQEEREISKEALGAYDKDVAFLENLKPDEVGAGENKHGIRQLVPLGWSDFRLRRALPLQHSFIIDVLIEEPKLSSGLRSSGRVKKDKESLKKDSKLGISAENDLNGKDDTVHGLKQSSPWTAQDPLPERIRINSKQIIDILSNIHGVPLCPDANESSSIALLRPFKILHAYDKEIRDRCSQLEDGGMKGQEQTQTSGLEDRTKQADSDLAPAEETIDKPSSAKDPKSATEKTGKIISWEDQNLQLEHLSCLLQFMDEFIGRKVTYLNSVSCIKISFFDVWHLFQPGTTVCSADGKQAYRVVNLESKRHKGVDRWDAFWTRKHEKKRRTTDSSDESEIDRSADITIKCVFIHFDGESFGPVIKKFHINKWDGEKEVTYLDVYPLRFHILKHIDKRTATSTTKIPTSVRQQEVEEGVQALTRKLVDRGRVFLDVAAVRQMYYSGLAVDTRDEIESQVMVDFEEALAHESRRHWIPNITRLPGTDWKSKADEVGEGCTAECCWRENVHDDAYVETSSTEKFINDVMAEIKDMPHKLPSTMIFPRPLEETKTGSNAFTDDELMIMSYSVFGFVLRDRTWAKLDLDCMSPVRAPENATTQMDDDFEEGGPGAFGQLVLPDGHKKMVLSLISQHFRNKESQESNDNHLDIVRGKGKSTRKGLIILLHGAPGVGKTTTAEGVAETFGQPLFQITCGDLGSNPKDVETALQTNFALANRWGCILLLDEADVFLAERRRTDFNRNGLVAVFLRVLEYYAGILFLTTNRIGDFDEAFASRIHMSLHYPALDEVSTAQVFRLNLGLIKTRLRERVKIEEDKIITAAQKHWRDHKDARWNGRQIRNACQTALALAEFDAQPQGKKYDIKEKSSAKVHLKLNHLQIVSNAYLEFTNYLKAVHGADADWRAKEAGLRTVDSILEAITSNSKEAGGNGQTGRENPLQGFRLGSGTTSQRPTQGFAAPSSPEPGSRRSPVSQGMHSVQRFAHEPTSVLPQRMQYDQSVYTENQSFVGGMRGGLHAASQHVQPGSYLQPPQKYSGVGHGERGQYQASEQYVHENQPQQGHGASYPSPPPSAVRSGSASGSARLEHLGDSQSRQGHRGQVPHDESEQM